MLLRLRGLVHAAWASYHHVKLVDEKLYFFFFGFQLKLYSKKPFLLLVWSEYTY